ncbi:MAG: rhomboid family intramembrane serine protease [Chloroflexi bacterium]|nr:rhomboid family intramembrane serine protease [Chloroflexota bacterium]
MIPLSDAPGPRRLKPIVNWLLILVNVGVFLYELSLGDRALSQLFYAAGVVPVEFTRGQEVGPPPPFGPTWTTVLTSMFMHAGFLHIGSNMLYLFIFGDNVEDRLGHVRYLLFYVLTGTIAAATHIAMNGNSAVPTVGASGAIAGVLGAYLVLFPRASVRTLLFIGPFFTVTRVSAFLLIGFWFVTQFFSGIASLGAPSEATGGVAVWAHVGGFVAGMVLLVVFRPRRAAAYAV